MKYRTTAMLHTMPKLALLHKLERGTADASDAWRVGEQIVNGDPCDDWPFDTVGKITWDMNHGNYRTA